MKYTSEIIVNLPLTQFIKKFDNPDNKKHWQRGLVSVEHISGDPGIAGTTMKLNYVIDKRKMEITETVTHWNLPHELHGTFSTKGIDNMQENTFEEVAEGQTKWKCVNEFLPLNFMMRLMLWFMPRAFKKQSLLYMTDFKNFTEKSISVTNEKA